MQSIQSNELKIHFARVLRQVEEGRGFLITKHKKVVAKLVPYVEKPTDSRLAVEAMKKLRCLDLNQDEIHEIRNMGRR